MNFNTIANVVKKALRLTGSQAAPPLAVAAFALVDRDGNITYAPTVTASTPVTTATLRFNTSGADELLQAVPAATIAALTIVFPDNAHSRVGQILGVVSHETVTTLTVTSTDLTLRGVAITALVADVPIFWRKIAASIWMRTNISDATSLASITTGTDLTDIGGNIGLTKEAARTITINASTTSDTAGGALTVAAGAGAATNAAGGAVIIAGGAGAGTGAGGAATLKGAVPGATGIGGAAIVVGGIGGASSGAGGAASVTGGAATAAATAGGAVAIAGGLSTTSAAGGAVTITGGAVGTTGIGGAVTIAGGVGGTSGARDGGAVILRGGACGAASTGAGGAASVIGGASANGATGKGGAVNITGGASGSTNDDGGSVVIAGGAKSGTGINGIVRLDGVTVKKLVPTTATDTTTLTVAQLKSGTVKCTPTAAAAYTMPTGAVLQAALPTSLAVGDSFDVTLVNIATNDSFDITLTTAASGITLIGNVIVEANSASTKASSGTFRIVATDVTGGAGTFDVYRVS